MTTFLSNGKPVTYAKFLIDVDIDVESLEQAIAATGLPLPLELVFALAIRMQGDHLDDSDIFDGFGDEILEMAYEKIIEERPDLSGNHDVLDDMLVDITHGIMGDYYLAADQAKNKMIGIVKQIRERHLDPATTCLENVLPDGSIVVSCRE